MDELRFCEDAMIREGSPLARMSHLAFLRALELGHITEEAEHRRFVFGLDDDEEVLFPYGMSEFRDDEYLSGVISQHQEMRQLFGERVLYLPTDVSRQHWTLC